jgi:hypothetical protein
LSQIEALHRRDCAARHAVDHHPALQNHQAFAAMFRSPGSPAESTNPPIISNHA